MATRSALPGHETIPANSKCEDRVNPAVLADSEDICAFFEEEKTEISTTHMQDIGNPFTDVYMDTGGDNEGGYIDNEGNQVFFSAGEDLSSPTLVELARQLDAMGRGEDIALNIPFREPLAKEAEIDEILGGDPTLTGIVQALRDMGNIYLS
ncbi:hypothetical protein PHLCEN_2v10252 [Hermanssonia centrifuga]|uniref:Uncharacterized protein n=1 Tax=Hermanssonia centrifuga TaxID=98765 RepID=A0A2R6NNG7_9APHY|nr:hypothetical protein PHLCEN_2v10252 [Hermanssonia centrifuga]